MLKRVFLTACAISALAACANMGNSGSANSSQQSASAHLAEPDNPMVSSRAASSQDFPQENELTPANPQQQKSGPQ